MPRHLKLASACLMAGALFAATAGERPMTSLVLHTATGSFTVQMKPLADSPAEGVTLGRLSLDKTFDGDLVGTGHGEMLTAMTPVQGSAGYVAIERVTGSLHGRSGSFVLQHTGMMDQGAQQLSITVVPGSGTGALVGLAGQFKLRIEQGQHFYSFDYTLPLP